MHADRKLTFSVCAPAFSLCAGRVPPLQAKLSQPAFVPSCPNSLAEGTKLFANSRPTNPVTVKSASIITPLIRAAGVDLKHRQAAMAGYLRDLHDGRVRLHRARYEAAAQGMCQRRRWARSATIAATPT
jgi:hypothetical protein